MDLTKPILEHVRENVGLSSEPSLFDTDLLTYINNAAAKLNQNGVGNNITIDSTTTWGDFQNPEQVDGNKYFHMVPMYITLSTKLIFDPPPPSSVQYHITIADETLWRLKIAYENTVGDVTNVQTC